MLLIVFGGALWAATNDVKFSIYNPPLRDTNQIALRITNRVKPPLEDSNRWAIYRNLDYTATNVLVECSHEPVLMGKSNGVWLLHFR